MVRFQLVIDCADPDRMARFWASALHYEFAPAPDGFATWDDFHRHLGFAEEDLAHGEDHLRDPDGAGPRIWFQKVPEIKTIKNRLHLDVSASGSPDLPEATRRARIDAEALRLAGLGATMLTDLRNEHFAVAMMDPEGNEFDLN